MLLWLCMDYTWWSCYCFLQGSEYVCLKELELSEEIFDHNEPNLICNCCTMLQLQLAIFFLLPRWLFSILEIFVCFSKNTFLFLYKNWCKVIFDLYAHFFNSWRKLSSVCSSVFFLKMMEIFVFRFKKIFDELKKECILKTLGYLTNYFSIL